MYQGDDHGSLQDMVDMLRFVTEAALASPWLLAVIVAMAVVDALLPVVPSEALIIAAGVAAVAGEQDLPAVIAAAAFGSFVGECAGYLIGRGIGPAVRTRFAADGRRAENYDRAARLLDRRGGTVLLTARFVPAGRTVATLASGATGYPVARFVGYTAVGSVLSASWSAMLGFVGGAAFAHDTVTALVVGFVFASVVGFVLEGVRRFRRGAPTPLRAPSVPSRTVDGARDDARYADGPDAAPGGQAAVNTTEWYPVAPSGSTGARSSVWVTPFASVARTVTTCEPGPASTSARHIRQVTPLTSVASSASAHGPSSRRTSTRLMPTGCDHAIPATVTRPAGVLP